MTRVDTNQIKRNASLIGFMEKDGVKLARCSDHFVCLCPFHREKTPSCHVWPDHYHCWGCAEHGDVITYVRKTRSLGFMAAIEVLGGSSLPACDYSPAPARTRVEEPAPDFTGMANQWLGETDEAAMNDFAFKLGVGGEPLWWIGACYASPHNAWAFPMRDARSRVIGIRLRDERGKKWAVKGSKQGIFIPSIAPEKRCAICEGPTDTCAALTLGLYAIGRPSCNGSVGLVLEFLRLHREIAEVVLITDNDEAGLRGSEALRKELPCRSYELLLPPKDIRKFVQIGGGKSLIDSLISSQVPWKGKGR